MDSKGKVDDTRLRIKSADESIKILQRLENSGGNAGENSVCLNTSHAPS